VVGGRTLNNVYRRGLCNAHFSGLQIERIKICQHNPPLKSSGSLLVSYFEPPVSRRESCLAIGIVFLNSEILECL
jgi:hypothetical protein